ncbi:ABC transporter C family protein [Heterostelium album PN500]|uniref:ABC transporter C family protein n=1 Tax=Heterostelium pallidum (strain ATCC 26659 / Pp 5 / PN500) TaxID=670386 RepID=D3BNB0_HETP5|nr:ABC transporter C family protein [Heterostelium album PN500]EFA76770.1 ABC transporter C family protein [Heterostelium album PN500]|eukprot:XP_020428902.1 ABC transporter C family protein [Heterostelium album PN500]
MVDSSETTKRKETRDERFQRKRAERKDVEGFGGQESPEENSFFLFKLTWDWANRFVWFCFRNVLEQKHIWNLASFDRAEMISEKMRKQWELEIKKEKPSYTRAGIRAFGPIYGIASIYYLIYIASQFVGPEMLSKMVIFVTKAKMHDPNLNLDLNWGYYYALIIFISAMIGSVCLYQSNMMTARVGDYMRSAIVCDVYRKALKLSNSARAKTSTGEIVNLMSNDAQRMIEVFIMVNNGIFAPVQIVVCVVLLYLKIKWITFVALGFMLLIVPINGVAAKSLMAVRRSLVRFTDIRVKTTNEILQSIKVIKLYAWEDSFAKRVFDKRANEIKHLFKFTYIRTGLVIVVVSVPTMVSMLVFSIYYEVNGRMDAGDIFAAVAYLNILRGPLTFLPLIIALVAQLQVATKRVTDFLLLDECETVKEPEDPTLPNGIYMDGAQLVWNPEKEDSFHLDDISMRCDGASLTMIVGSVGSGKSTLCQSMLGELSLQKGSLGVRGSIAYAAQQPCITNASLRDNILFGKEMNEERYLEVIECCALERDLEMFPQGDLVEIGERGVNLSGGQKQRVSIARAVYSDADIYIFDDPLSAVDAHVGKHLFHKCINGVLKNKTVILSSNQLQYLPYASHVVVLAHNGISERGTYQEILDSKQEFSKQIIEYGIEETNEAVDTEMEVEIKEKTKSDKIVLKNKDGKLIQQEEREEGSVSLRVYLKYFTAGGALHFIVAMILYLLDVGSSIFTNWWLSHWSNSQPEITAKGTADGLTNRQFLFCFIGIGFGSILITCFRTITFFSYCVKVGRYLHNKLFSAILRAPMWFFDTTPLGRIINRFTRDLDSVDNLISSSIAQYINFFLTVIGTIIIMATVIPKLLIVLAPLVILFYILQSFYRHTSRELQRLEAISRSPIFAHFTETLNGVATLRAYKSIDANIKLNMKYLNNNNSAYLTLQACMQWLGLRLDLIGNIVIFFTFIFINLSRDSIELGSIGLALSYSLSLTQSLNRATLQAADTETKMNSVERILHYINGPTEAKQIIEECRPDPQWPQQGGIVFDNLVMRYREGLDPVLKGISCEIKPKEKVGIVGRTGAGKSSIVLALFRLVEASEGRILIDGEDISKFGLKDLRKNLSIIPQDPVLFSGTLRENLDPFNEKSDADLWDLLENIQLAAVVRGNEGGLLCKVTDNGDNWSVGQKQLICLGRALLRKPKVLVLDEATASVDSKTDQLIQLTVRSKFSDCTILTIAHRLNTIMDSDRIIVLDAGKVSEFDSPHNLLQNPNGLLTWLVEETGPQNAKLLRKIAKAGKYITSLDEEVETDSNSIETPQVETPPTQNVEETIKVEDLDEESSSSSSSSNENNNQNE